MTLARLAGASLLILLWAARSAASEAPGPRELIRETVDEVIAILQDPHLDEQQRQSRIEDLAYQRFHFETMSRLVLGRSWRTFSKAQRQEFMHEFRIMLSRSYGERLTRYDQEKVKILKVRDEPRGDVSVVTRIKGGPADGVEIIYRLRKREGKWGVIDVKVEGVGLVSNYKAQFAELLGNGTPDDLLRRMREKNAEAPDAGATPTTTAGS